MNFYRLGSCRGRGWSLSVHLCATFLVFIVGSSAAFAVKPAGTGPSAKQGEQIFHQRCIVCHNKQPNDMTPFGPPNLYKAFRGHSLTPSQAATIIMNGKGQMPPFKGTLTRPEIESVIAYLRSH